MCWCGRIPMEGPNANGGSNKWDIWENLKRQVHNLWFSCRSGYQEVWKVEQWIYPKRVESAVTMLSLYMNDKGVHMTDEDKGQTNQKSFMQKHKNVTCYKCGKKGHYANKCPSGDSNDNELSTRSNSSLLSNSSNHRRPDRIGWSG